MFEQRYNRFTDRHHRRRRRQRVVVALRCLVLALGAALLVEAGVALLVSPRFAVSRVRVEARGWVPAAEVGQLAAVPAGCNLLRFPTGRLRERLERHPGVAAATVRRRLPGMLVVRVQARQPLVFVRGERGINYVDRGGHVFAGPEKAAAGVPELQGVPASRPGRMLGGRMMQDICAVLAALRGEGLNPEALRLDGKGWVTARLPSGAEVRLGSAAEVRKKAWLARLALAQLAGEQEIEYLDLSSMETPVWKPRQAGGGGPVGGNQLR